MSEDHMILIPESQWTAMQAEQAADWVVQLTNERDAFRAEIERLKTRLTALERVAVVVREHTPTLLHCAPRKAQEAGLAFKNALAALPEAWEEKGDQ